MQAINVFENGIGYLSECLKLYLGSCAYLMLFMCAAIYLFVKGNKEEKELFLPGAILMLITVYNPLFPVVIDKFFDISSEYYRFFWLSPVVILVPFVVSKMINDAKSTHEKVAITAFILVVGLLSGEFVYELGIPVAENIYKVPDELIEIDEIIHDDSQSEYTKAFFEYEYNMEIRQYDPKMLLTIDREEYLYAVNYSYSEEMIMDENVPTNCILAALVRNQDVDTDRLAQALEATGTQYVVITKGHYKAPQLEDAGLTLLGSTATHNIYKNQLSEQADYSLIDYSDVEHRFSYRRLK